MSSETPNSLYPFSSIEKKWLDYYEEKKPFKAEIRKDKEKYYCLEMFPYPSGKIHMGHVRNYSIGDVLARYKRLRGFNVLHPIGWDSFGMPAENAAIDNQVHPALWTDKNIDEMRAQLKRLGFSYDWDNEVQTSSPDYYRWGQSIFQAFYEKGLSYRKEAKVNWDPVEQTVLANEQVVDGKGWRSGVPVEIKNIPQWFFKTTDYAQQLLDDHEQLKGQWPEAVLTMQKNWIGRSIGATINFQFGSEDFPIFTTRPDTLYGVTYMAIAFDHPDVKKYVGDDVSKEDIEAFIKRCQSIDQNSDYTKEGIFTGSYIKHPLNGENIPLYIANFVLAAYGTGAIMAVPAHDQRDFDFAKVYNIPIKVVIQNPEKSLSPESMSEAWVDDGTLVNSGPFDGKNNREAIPELISYMEKEGLGHKEINYKLKDWLLSRQRYWGNPIPVVYDKDGKESLVDKNELPVLLPTDVEFKVGSNPLLSSESFNRLDEKRYGHGARRETDTMDTFTCSSWYFLRYTDPKNAEKPFDKEKADYWGPVDQYIGGIEHACMHLLYARFFHKAMRDLGWVSGDEPFKNLLTQGMVCNHSFYQEGEDGGRKKYINPQDVELVKDEKGKITEAKRSDNGEKVTIGRVEKMSKSKNNGVDPNSIIDRYGADTARLFVLFAAPPEKDLEWNEAGVEGCHRFVKRVFRFASEKAQAIQAISESGDLGESAQRVQKKWHQTVKKVTSDIENGIQLNTAVAAQMEFFNELSRIELNNTQETEIFKSIMQDFAVLMSPFTPFVAEEIGRLYGCETPVMSQNWPVHDESLIAEDEVTLVVQVNGKVRAKLPMAKGCDRETALATAKAEGNVNKWLEGKSIVKEIVIPDKLINLVVK